MVPAAEVLTFELQRGRVLRGWPLAVVVFLRNVPWYVASLTVLDLDEVSAPCWVVVRDRGTRQVRARIPAGRWPGDGDDLLEAVVRYADELTAEQLLTRYRRWARPGRHRVVRR